MWCDWCQCLSCECSFGYGEWFVSLVLRVVVVWLAHVEDGVGLMSSVLSCDACSFKCSVMGSVCVSECKC